MRDLLWDDMSDEVRAQAVLDCIAEQRAAGVPRAQLRLPCGELMVLDRRQHDPAGYVSYLDSRPGSWEWSEDARKQHPGLGRRCNGVVTRRAR